MSKKLLLITITVLMFASIAIGQQWWWYNKTILYLPRNQAQQAWDLDVIVRPNSPATLAFLELFQNFSQKPVWTQRWGWCRLLRWWNPQPGPLNWGGITHIGAGGIPGGGRIVDMYFTDQFGRRIPRSLCWNLSSGRRYWSRLTQTAPPAGTLTFYLINEITPLDEEGKPSTDPWDAPREATARDVMYAVVDEPISLDFLNDSNAYLNDTLLKPLHEGDIVVLPKDSVEFTIPETVSPGQYAIFRWDNFAPSIDESDSTQARDWVEYLIVEEASKVGVEEHGSLEPQNLLEVTSISEHPEIHYQLPEAAKVTLAIYSVTGERVATLVDETKATGSYTVRWDTSGIPSGVYICKLSVDGLQVTEKMVRVK